MSLLAAADLAHARSRGYQRRLDQARRLVHDAPEGAICGVSWGKDSVALLSIVREIRPEMPVMHYRWPPQERPAGLDRVRDEMIVRYGLSPRFPAWEDPDDAVLLGLRQIRPGSSEFWPLSKWELLSDLSHPCRHSPSNGPPYLELPVNGRTESWRRAGTAWLIARTREQRAADREVMAENGARLRAAFETLGATASLIGIRARESRARMLHLASRGLTWWNSEWDLPTIAPLGWWTAQDVWARHAECDLPSADHYHCGHGEGRDRIRSEVGLAETAAATWRYGQGRFWRLATPRLWTALTNEFPEVERW